MLGGMKQQRASCHAKVGTSFDKPGRAMENFRHVRLTFQKTGSSYEGLGRPESSEEHCGAGPGEEPPSQARPALEAGPYFLNNVEAVMTASSSHAQATVPFFLKLLIKLSEKALMCFRLANTDLLIPYP